MSDLERRVERLEGDLPAPGEHLDVTIRRTDWDADGRLVEVGRTRSVIVEGALVYHDTRTTEAPRERP